jgi:predicted small integral membrane protein
MSFRVSKLLVVAAVGFYLLMVAFNNIADPAPNLEFVSHIMSMDDVFPENQERWRGFPQNGMHWLFFIIIVITELAAAVFCFWGAYVMWNSRQQSAEVFAQAKRKAVLGLTIAFLLWFFAFITVGGEWFFMWQAGNWNGIPTAFRNAAITLPALLYLHLGDD